MVVACISFWRLVGHSKADDSSWYLHAARKYGSGIRDRRLSSRRRRLPSVGSHADLRANLRRKRKFLAREEPTETWFPARRNHSQKPNPSLLFKSHCRITKALEGQGQALVDLEENTTYYYTAMGANLKGTSKGRVNSFTTARCEK